MTKKPIKKLTLPQVKRLVLDHIKKNELEVNDRYKKHYIDRTKETTGVNGLIMVLSEYHSVSFSLASLRFINLMIVDKE